MDTSGSEIRNGTPGIEEDKEEVRGSATRVIGHEVTVLQSGVQSIEADSITVRQGGAVQVKAGRAEFTSSGIVYSQSQQATLSSSHVRLLLTQDRASLDQTGVLVLGAAGPVEMKQSGAAVLVSRDVRLDKNSGVIFLLAKNISGEVHPLFGPKEAAYFGAAAGLVGGLLFLLSRFLTPNRNSR